MRNLLKKTFLILPVSFRRLIVLIRDYYWQTKMQSWEKEHYPSVLNTVYRKKESTRKNILVYSVNGLGHGGTEKNLQLIANALSDNCQVFYMYGKKERNDYSTKKLNENITTIFFSYQDNEIQVPHKLSGMSPHVKKIITDNNIDLLITASPGYAHYPWNTIQNIPIVLLNIFGAPTLQKNIVKVVYNSETTRRHAEQWIGPDDRAEVKYAPLFKKPAENHMELGTQLRKRFNIPADDFVFGRIGRNDDGIFDPIGIRAWQKIVEYYPKAHYLIMSPPPTLVKIVKEENIPRVHFIDPSSEEDDVWAFHSAIDCMAHFRFDGETSGVAIAESLTLGNPVITHHSHVWNAHTEYLTDDFSRVVNKDDVDAYAKAMEEFIEIKKRTGSSWSSMEKMAISIGRKYFSSEEYSIFIKNLIDKI